MDLYVLRHGVAEDRDSLKYPDDGERPLTARGVRRLAREARGMNSIKLRPDLTLTSPLVRAVQTAETILEGLDASCPLQASGALVPWADPEDILVELETNHATLTSVMIVGHEPHLSSLISLVASGSLNTAIRLRKGALCRLKIPTLSTGQCGEIEWSLTPGQMMKLG